MIDVIFLTFKNASTSRCLAAKCLMRLDLSMATYRHLGQLNGTHLARRGDILSLK